jgi:hypothetical protein
LDSNHQDTSAAGIARAISTLVEEKATHRAFLEIKVAGLLEHVGAAKPPGWEQVWPLLDDLFLCDTQAAMILIITQH